MVTCNFFEWNLYSLKKSYRIPRDVKKGRKTTHSAFYSMSTNLLVLLFLVSSVILSTYSYYQGLIVQVSSDLNNGVDGGISSHFKYQVEDFSIKPSYYPGEQVWNRTWGGTDGDYGEAVWSDGMYVYVCGSTTTFGAGLHDLLLTVWDVNGAQLWNRTFGGQYEDEGLSLWSNGTYIYTCGYTDSFGPGNGDLLLIKWDDNGVRVWNQTWGGSKREEGKGVCGNGSYIYTCGYTFSYGAGTIDSLLIKWDSDGNQLWNRIWGGSDGDCGYAVWIEGNYIYTCGWTDSYGAGDTDLFLVKWDADGNQVWNRTWGGLASDWASSIWGDGTYIYTFGQTQSTGAGSIDLLLVKWDADGNQIWNRTWGDLYNDVGYSVYGDGTYIYTCGYTNSTDTGVLNLLLVKWDANGNQIWNRTWGGSDHDLGTSVWCDGTQIFTCGYTFSFGAGLGDVLLVKWNAPTIDLMDSDLDSDGLTYYEEFYIYNTNVMNPDTDNDGLSDGEEVHLYGTNPLLSDTDGDGLSDGSEIDLYGTNQLLSDTDSDGLSDASEILIYSTNATDNDTDKDSLSDGQEVNLYGTNPLLSDTDGDGFSDGLEINQYKTDPLLIDTDSDGLSDSDELLTYQTNATNNDTDTDGIPDGWEVLNSLDPKDSTDNITDSDGDSLLNIYEYGNKTWANDSDSDDDGLSDGSEIITYGTNATNSDTDSDGLSDGDEILNYSTNATNADSDGDGYNDGAEVLAGTDPLNPSDNPGAETGTIPGFPARVLVLSIMFVLIFVLLNTFRKGRFCKPDLNLI
ncbi:MAG: binary toxin-like calcium binding domain-containing protein [Promethearchaeota archaeon]